ncbi:hypothetical protein CIL05_09740 [Virgibacillus profundi]|uniref:Permease n=1 Tax=Virgibacillus profundi TaxID=2024555 RepID=A0A2A2IER7_9BACI|nr:YitT family protein [Virgibacillus profundi]PAV29645.1 hypothetical protein CIL05_09740 [Virgibacillus profundi]PXY53817.1 hypothetical protein CIT14_09830 [Virgibacillus profundi]
MIHVIRWIFYMSGLMVFSFGITVTLKMQHLGVHPWDVLNVAMYEKVGLSIGSWAIIFSIVLIIVSWILDKSYIKIGTFLNAILVGAFVDLFLWLDFLPNASHAWTDILIIIIGIIIMGIGGGLYNSAEVGAGPRDGFMLSISDKTGASVGKVRIITETLVLIIGLILGGPVFVITFIFTFVQSPIFAFSFEKFKKVIAFIQSRHIKRQYSRSSA